MRIPTTVSLHCFVLLEFLTTSLMGISWNIKIGVLHSNETQSLHNVLRSVFRHMLRGRMPPELQLSLVDVRTGDNDLLSRDVASKLSDVVSIIDLASKDEKALALSSLLQVPLMKVDTIGDDLPHPFVMSIRPSFRVISQALFDLMDFFSFTRVAVVYDARKSRQASHFYAQARRWPRFNIEMMPELLLHNKFKLRQALTVMLKSHFREIILFCNQEDLASIMNEALFVGFNDKSYKWITSDLEVAGPNRTYPSTLGMLGLRLHLGNKDAANDLEMAARGMGVKYSKVMYSAVYDAAYTVAEAVKNFLQRVDGKKVIATRLADANCPMQSLASEHRGLGQRMLDEIKKVKFKGVTGQVEFDSMTGDRRVQDGLDVLNVLEKDVIKVGSWQPEPGANEHSVMVSSSEPPKWVGDFADFVKCHNPGNAGPPGTVGIPTLKVTTVLETPFVEIRNKSLKKPSGLISGDMVQGFCIDLIEELSKQANFRYEIYLRQDKSYGGMVDELSDQTMDLALAPITITAERELLIDFTKPFMDFSMSLIMQKPGDPPINYFAFLQPFTGSVWLSTVGVVLFITVMICVIDFLSPFGYRARARESDEEPGNEFNLFNSLWFATASVLQQGPDNTPLAPSGRLLASTFWFFILILISTYTANLAAFFTIKRTADTINSLEALANQNKIKYGVYGGGSVRKFFENSENSLYRKMFSHMREYQTFVADTTEGVEKSRTEDYAYITEYPYLEYYNQQKPCNTRLLNNLLQAKSYGIGLQRNSPYTNKISVAILELREKNFIERTRRKWWDERSQCPKPSQSKTGKTQSLDVNNLAGVFIILLGGVIISIILVIIEIRCKSLVTYLTNSQCRRGEEDEDEEDLPMENIRHVEPVAKVSNEVNLYFLDKYARAPESKL